MDFRLDKVDDVFCCIGTTIKKAGSKDAFAKVDRDYVIDLGKWAKIEEPEETIKLFMVDFHHCDHKKCTGKKMERFKLLSTIKDKKHK